jgi:hypothetical protein
VSYTWHEPNTPDFPRTVVTWELEEIADNKTHVNLLHSGFEPGKLFKHDEGWSYFLNRLQNYCKKCEVDGAIRFVSSNKAKEELKSASNGRNEDNTEAKEP